MNIDSTIGCLCTDVIEMSMRKRLVLPHGFRGFSVCWFGQNITVAGSCGIRERVVKKQIKGWATLKQSKDVLLHASVFQASAISLSQCSKAVLLIPGNSPHNLSISRSSHTDPPSTHCIALVGISYSPPVRTVAEPLACPTPRSHFPFSL